ncbi:MAG: acyltransferase [Gammaproteobacteria bacterium]|nr:acyltransferase [Gammaproteobacteria bacterium]MBU0848445.1 acyltransferase [Gammaproteobacteria bacterium]MBU1530443.1 acyltransferase [Gammaproteobacteria bacterium]MBU1780346.1 acyltransferase [Gammaproteobacteria bacterium]MBU2087956.1 acyltransferase [Gammaproteobacteria bacterium]
MKIARGTCFQSYTASLPTHAVRTVRNSTIDLLKVFASQIIVIHHLLLYTPMSPVLQAKWPDLLGFIAIEGRYVVQIFLVIGGFLTAQSLFNMLKKGRKVAVWPLFKKRFLRLAKPFWVAIAVAVLLGWLGSKIAVHDEIADLPSVTQLLAHVFLLHDIVEVEALSAGVWYVAIDLQLYAVLVLLGWLSQRLGQQSDRWIKPAHALLLLACAMAVASLLVWNRNAEHDEWAWYFFGAYGLGVLAHWAQREGKVVWGSVMILGVLGIALSIEWRERLLLTGATALLLINSARIERFVALIVQGPVRWLGDISYSVFLIHYGIAVFASSVVIALGLAGFAEMLMAFVLTWALSVAAGWVLYWGVERG